MEYTALGIHLMGFLPYLKQTAHCSTLFSKHSYNIRSNHNIKLPKHHTSFIIVNGMDFFNCLPLSL